MSNHQPRFIAVGNAKTAFYLSCTRSISPPDFGKENQYDKKIRYNIYLYRNGSENSHRAAMGGSSTANLPDIEINGGRGEQLKALLFNYNYSHQLAMVEYEISKDGRLALEPNYHRPKKPAYDLVRIDAKLAVLHDLKGEGVEYIQPYRDRPDVIWSIDQAISKVASNHAPRVFGKMPLAEDTQ